MLNRLLAAAACCTCLSFGPTTGPAPFVVIVSVDAGKRGETVRPIWRFFGYDEPNFTYMPDGQKLLGELGQLSTKEQPVYVRCHHLLTTGDGVPSLKWGSTNAYTEDARGKPIYDWTITDKIFDTYVRNGLKPYVQIGFMPEALSVHPQDYPKHPKREVPLSPKAGQAYPPGDYGKWRELCQQWVLHCVDRYGKAEAASWYWEVWNEPNIDYWNGSRDDYFKLYDYSIAGVRAALPEARVGGPETAGGAGGTFLRDFLAHCDSGKNFATGTVGSPLDFVSFHAKGRPKVVDGHVRMGMSAQLKDMNGAMAVIASFPKYKQLPVMIGESDPEGCAACRGPANAYRNGTMYSSYTAASFPRVLQLATEHGVNLEGALTWAFEFENEPYFAGFRALSTNQIDLPVLNVFRMFSMLKGRTLPVTTTAGHTATEIIRAGVTADHPDVSAVAAMTDDTITVMLWHYTNDDTAGPDAEITMNLSNLAWPDGPLKAQCFTIDDAHGNAYAAWLRMGSPQPPSAEQIRRLQTTSRMTPEPIAVSAIVKNSAAVQIRLARHGVTLIELHH